MGPLADRVKNLGDESAFKVGDDIRKCEAKGLSVVRLNIGEPDFDSAPNINRVAIQNIEDGNSHYIDPQGILSFRGSIARVMAETRNIQLPPDHIVVTSGGKPVIGYSMIAYVNPGDEVIYPSPGFPIYESWITFLGAVPVPVYLKEEKDFRFDATDLEPLVTSKTKLLIINSPSNPTGCVLTREDLSGIASLLAQKADPNFRILSDEVYDEIVFDGLRHESMLSVPGMDRHTILLNSLSKSFAMTGWRLGYAVLPTVEEAMLFRQLNINTYSCTPPFIQMAGKAALDNKENKTIVSAMRREFQTRRDVMIEALNRIDGICCVKPAGAFYAYPNITGVCEKLGILSAYEEKARNLKDIASPSTLFQLFALYVHGVATLDRSSFGQIGCENSHYLRLSMASDMETLKEGIGRLADASADVDGFQDFMNRWLKA